jgi:hypothetical protein
MKKWECRISIGDFTKAVGLSFSVIIKSKKEPTLKKIVEVARCCLDSMDGENLDERDDGCRFIVLHTNYLNVKESDVAEICELKEDCKIIR